MVARTVPVEAFDLIVFGGTGDLARRKLLPALYHRFAAGQTPGDALIIGAARRRMDGAGYRDFAREALTEFVPESHLKPDLVEGFIAMLDYVPVDAATEAGWAALGRKLKGREARPRAFYLSVAPQFFGQICERIGRGRLVTPETRLVVEKPLGRDLASARALNAQLASHFDEHQIYRIDHYLGKETVQNLMALRFANALFEPLWNANHIDHVQITAAESVGVGERGGYYDQNGAMRDMVQNHLMQLLCLSAMEPPSRFDPDAVRDEKLKVLKALRPIEGAAIDEEIVRGQYEAGPDGPAYREEAGDPESRTECFIALKIGVENWRWAGTPFYLRTGKRLKARHTEIAIRFKDAPHSIFGDSAGALKGNALVITLQPNEGIELRLNIKDPGPGGMRIVSAPLDMSFGSGAGDAFRMPDAYERLLMDVIRGDQTLFMRGDEVEAAWAWIDPIIAGCEEGRAPPAPYAQRAEGPMESHILLHKDGRRWREIA
ncbi:glucose-6-phosphate dehydrogenase [Pikeienuella piscinae]|uniref:Glucose-6-phosphate 1-dehydrogenase n=1 Tax=Pikeienuella piscinae TaxID=2748098 RepID=A0A7L5BU28_9RHOB|nr:glucose-6-phosphate dehydrogenase [Pikeienuella piscinae]QIE55235.1 glucose-6-phosphate dehydrogenase [Pikeienuella piscinae]